MAGVKPGDRISEYTLVEKIGEGRFGEVWKARHVDIPNKLVAIKFPKTKEDLEYIKKEAIFQHNLQHPNIVKTLGLNLEHSPPYFVMEYVPGVNLRRLMLEDGILPPNSAINITTQILSALHFAHSKGVLHKDIKPENIIVIKRVGKTPSGKKKAKYLVKVSDLGLGRPLQPNPEEIALSATEGKPLPMLSGTLFYVAPEVIFGQLADKRSDIYSVGVVLYEMLTGTVPFGIDMPSEVNPFVHEALDPIVKKALSFDRDRRYQSAHEMHADLLKAKRIVKEEIRLMRAEKKQKPPLPAKPEQSKPRKKRPPILEMCVLIALALSIILIVVALSILLKGRQAPEISPLKYIKTLTLQSNPQGADVFIDKKHYGKTPVSIHDLLLSKHHVRLHKRFYKDKNFVIEPVEENGKTFCKITCADTQKYMGRKNPRQEIRISTELERQKGLLVLKSSDIIDIFIDGKFAGKTPGEFEVYEGTHQICLKKKGFKPKEFLVVVEGEKEIKNLTLSPQASSPVEFGKLLIKTEPSGALIYIENKIIGESPCEIELCKGSLKLKISKKYYKTKQIEVDAPKGKKREISIPLERLNCNIFIDSQPQGAKVYFSNRYIGKTPLSGKFVADKYKIKIETEGYYPFFQEIDLCEEKDYRLWCKLKPLPTETKVIVTCEINGLDLFVNNKKTGKLPVTFNLPSGTVVFRVLDIAKKVDIKAGEKYKLVFTKEDLGLVLIPHGKYKTPEGSKMVKNDFYMDMFEVTNKKYALFLNYIKATNDHSKCHKDEPKNKDHTPRFWNNPEFNKEDQPVVGIDFYDAYAYAAWAGKSLPDEQEWEKASAGEDGMEFPWGREWIDDAANWGDFGEKDGYRGIAPAGSFPKGKSLYGCYDMIGNVWEICQNDYKKGYKVIKGSSYLEAEGISNFARHFIGKLSRCTSVGFRCVLRIKGR